MRFMIMVKATEATEAGVMPEERLMSALAESHEKLVNAGVLLDASGLQPRSKGARIRYSGGKRTVIEGPFTGADGEIEIRQLFELEDFGPSEAVERFREMGVATKQ